jgi:capsular polysaccharide biosynthesis protein
MEVRDYIKFLSRNYVIVITTTLIFAIVTYAVTVMQPDTYQSSASLEAIRSEAKPQSEVPYFQYDNYYSYQAASAASDNLIGWIESASTVAQIYDKAGYQKPSANIKDLSKTFTATKTVGTSAVVSISYSSKDREQAEKMVSTATEVLKEKVEAYNKSSDQSQNIFSAQYSEPVTVVAPKMEMLNVAIATFIGLLVAIGTVSIKEAVRVK